LRRLTIEQWEKKYIVGGVKQFDQKNHMFIRPVWDPEINGLLDDWSFIGPVKEEAGYTLEDQALRWASNRGTMMTLFNAYKPNQGPAAKRIQETMAKGPFTGYQPPEGQKTAVSDPEKATQMIKKAALWFGADLVGICKLDRRWLYSHTVERSEMIGSINEVVDVESIPQKVPEDIQYAVVMAFEMDYELMRYVPSYLGNTATRMGYSRMAVTNNYMTSFISNLGFDAIDCTMNDVALSIPMALQAGLGDLARNGLMVTRKYGPRVRLNNVLTNMPLVPDEPVDFGVTEFCMSCEICAEKCPSQSILYGERTTRSHNISNVGGVLKWPINAVTCRQYWGRRHSPCAICITVCPYNKPDTVFHRFVRWCTDHMRWADPIYVKADEWAGYGKPIKADRFWEEWSPRKN
jgi:reductive dehalogenase